MKEKLNHNALLIAIVTVIVALDQWTKILVSHKLALGESISPIKALDGFFKIVHWHNTGAAFGLFQNANLVLLITSIVIVIAVLFYYQGVKKNAWLAKVSLSLIVAGALGNIVDRIKFNYVIDFLSFGKFPVFNVADSAVTVGVFLMVIYFFISEKKAKEETLLEENVPTVALETEDSAESEELVHNEDAS